MDKRDFLTSKELGIEADDNLFMSRFENNLSLERRPSFERKRDWISIVEIVVAAAVVVLGLWMSDPLWHPYVQSAQRFVANRLSAYGLGLSSVLIFAGGVAGLLIAGLPEIGSELWSGLVDEA